MTRLTVAELDAMAGNIKAVVPKPVDAAAKFAGQLRMAGAPEPVREYRFAAEYVGLGPGLRERLLWAHMQDWRFDLCWPSQKVACEVDGGGWTGGRHSRGVGMESDCAKLSTAVVLGWRVLRVTPKHVKSGQAYTWVCACLSFHDGAWEPRVDLPPK
jgi:hypothetical protein